MAKKASTRKRSAKKVPSAKEAAGVSDAAVRNRTGKAWDEWFAILDRAGAAERDHKGIVAVLAEEHPELGGWWTQMVTVAYEQARGLREKHQKPGGYSAGKSKTFGVPVARLYRAWSDGRTRSRWLDEELTVRKSTPEKSMRITWSDGRSSVHVNFYAKGPEKSQVAIQHEKLASAEEVARAKELWGAALGRLAEVLT